MKLLFDPNIYGERYAELMTKLMRNEHIDIELRELNALRIQIVDATKAGGVK